MSEAATRGLRRAVFLDRDGVLNELVIRDGLAASPRRVADFRIADGAAEQLGRLRGLGLLIFVVTNQPDVARGQLDRRELAGIVDKLAGALEIDEIAVCPHDDADGCECRKPKPGMLLALSDRWAVDLTRSFVVGDSWKDVEAGRQAGCRTILLDRGDGRAVTPDWRVASLRDAVGVIESELDAATGETRGIRR